MKPVMTRKQYMSKEVTHAQYYSQFVTDEIVRLVKISVGERRIIDSIDPHFNDIPLSTWDYMNPLIKIYINRELWREANEWTDKSSYPWSLSDGVCIAKAAARIIKKNLEDKENLK